MRQSIRQQENVFHTRRMRWAPYRNKTGRKVNLNRFRNQPMRHRWPKIYKPTDHTKRHRKGDAQPKTVLVPAHKRRL